MWFIYILECADGSLYTGMTNDLERRFSEHKDGKGGHYTASHAVTKRVHSEEFKTRSDAAKREAEIKSWPREKKLNLIKRK
jgi:putative endonuclease